MEKSNKRKLDDIINIIEPNLNNKHIKLQNSETDIINIGDDSIIYNTIPRRNIITYKKLNITDTYTLNNILNHYFPDIIINLKTFINWFSICKLNRNYIKNGYLENICKFIDQSVIKNKTLYNNYKLEKNLKYKYEYIYNSRYLLKSKIVIASYKCLLDKIELPFEKLVNSNKNITICSISELKELFKVMDICNDYGDILSHIEDVISLFSVINEFNLKISYNGNVMSVKDISQSKSKADKDKETFLILKIPLFTSYYF
jgi:hypothetical protein